MDKAGFIFCSLYVLGLFFSLLSSVLVVLYTNGSKYGWLGLVGSLIIILSIFYHYLDSKYKNHKYKYSTPYAYDHVPDIHYP